MRTRYRAFCFAGGDIHIGMTVPKGAIVIASGSYRELKSGMEMLARHGYQDGVLLVPGVPEAASPEEALEALVKFVDWIGQITTAYSVRSIADVRRDINRLVTNMEGLE